MQLGVIGLGTMGANLARNAARNGVTVAIFNRTEEKTDEFMEKYAEEGEFIPCKSYREMIGSLEGHRVILLMVKAGDAVDAVIEELLPLLSKGDVLIDGGNSHYADTNRRTASLRDKEIAFIGMGVSGGDEGALHGPSMMPGGDEEAFRHVEPMLQAMAADDGDGGKCVSYMGPGGAGHFVKMVHNGIEYGIMQLMAESYDLLKNLGNFTNEDLAEIFTAWNDSEELQSFLAEITAQIFQQKDATSGGDLIDMIKDVAGQKGTGKWTTQAALDLGVTIPTINAAVDARIISGGLEERQAHKDMPVMVDDTEPVPRPMKFRSAIRSAMELSSMIAYNQGFALIQKASEDFEWNIDMSTVARIWRGGCIIRSALLKRYQNLYGEDKALSTAAAQRMQERFGGDRQVEWRQVVELGISWNVPVPALSASLTYYDALTRPRLPQNLIQAQRDFFGAHTYARTDAEGAFHTNWHADE